MKDTTFSESSELRIYSLGIVVANLGSFINVSPVETFNVQTSGVISKNKNEYTAQHPDERGVVNKTKVSSNNLLQARWLPLAASNRATAPTVYPNETVLLWRYGNEDRFFWTSLFHETHLRKTESAVYSYSNLPDRVGVGKGWSDEKTPNEYTRMTSYWMEINALSKIVSFTTPKNDGEVTTYSVSINTGAGLLDISDGMHNSIMIDSAQGLIVINAREKLVLNAGKGGIHLNSKNGIHMNAKTDIKAFAGNNIYYRAIKHNFEGVTYHSDQINCMSIIRANGFTSSPQAGVSSSNDYTQEVENASDSAQDSTSIGDKLTKVATEGGEAKSGSSSSEVSYQDMLNLAILMTGGSNSASSASASSDSAKTQAAGSSGSAAVNSNVQTSVPVASPPVPSATVDLATIFKNSGV